MRNKLDGESRRGRDTRNSKRRGRGSFSRPRYRSRKWQIRGQTPEEPRSAHEEVHPPNRHSLSPRTYHRGRWITLRRNYGKQRVKSLLYPLTTLRRIAATAKQAGFWGKIMIFATGANVSEYSMPYPWVKPLATRRALYRSSVPSE